MKIKCHECGRRYDPSSDEFCPHCGAFNHQKRETASVSTATPPTSTARSSAPQQRGGQSTPSGGYNAPRSTWGTQQQRGVPSNTVRTVPHVAGTPEKKKNWVKIVLIGIGALVVWQMILGILGFALGALFYFL